MPIRVTIRGLDEHVKRLTRFPARLRLALVKAMQDSVILIQSLAKENAPVFRGHLRVSIKQSVNQKGGKIVGNVGSPLVYASVVESGRTTGWFPPVKDLKAWARRKLGDERKAFVVARAISKRGFKKQPYLMPALERSKSRIQAIFSQRLSEAAQAEGGTA